MSRPSPEQVEDRLRDAMSPTPSDLRSDPEFEARVLRRAETIRRRATALKWGAVPVAAAVATAVVIVTVNEQSDPNGTPPPAQRGDHGESPRTIRDWLENKSAGRAVADPGKPALAGTTLYRSCNGDDCDIRLTSPSGRELDLDDYNPELAAHLAEDGLDGVSLSPNGHLLGYADVGAYRIHRIGEPGAAATVPDEGPGDRWELVGWSEQSWAPALARYDDERIVRFADWRAGTEPGRHDPTYLAVPDGVTTTPILGHRPELSPVAEPAEPSDGIMPHVDTTRPPDGRWFNVEGYGYGEHGTIVENDAEHYGFSDFGRCVGPDETLAGPDGRIRQWEVRGTRAVHADIVAMTTAVYARDAESYDPVAVVVNGCEEGRYPSPVAKAGRVDLPSSTADVTWEFLGPLPGGEVAMTRTTDGTQTYMRIDPRGDAHPMTDLPADAEVIVPGGLSD